MRKIVFLSAFFFLSQVFCSGAERSAKFGGVGIDGVPSPDGEIRVRQLVAGGPAHRAGIRLDDVITAIDGKLTKGSSFGEMVEKRLRGREGTKVVLTIRRSGQPKPLRFTLVRRQLITAGK